MIAGRPPSGRPPSQSKGAGLRGIQGGRRAGVSFAPGAQQGPPSFNQYMVPAQDQHGHSARIDSRLPPSMAKDVSSLIEQGRFPFEGKSDFYRWAIHLGLQTCRELGGVGMSAATKTLIALYQEEQANLNFKSIVEALINTVQRLLSDGATENAKRLVRSAMRTVEEMDEPYWRDRYSEALRERFGHLMRKP